MIATSSNGVNCFRPLTMIQDCYLAETQIQFTKFVNDENDKLKVRFLSYFTTEKIILCPLEAVICSIIFSYNICFGKRKKLISQKVAKLF